MGHSDFRAAFRRAGLTLCCLLLSGSAQASGVVGEHVQDLQGHLEHYEQEVRKLIAQVGEIVTGYELGGAEEARADRVVEFWEAVDFHAAIETNYVPIYASIWQGLFGVKSAVDEGKSVQDVRAAHVALSESLWQGLGAVKLAAQIQQTQAAQAASLEGAATPTAALLEVDHELDRVLAKYAEQLGGEATSIVHSAYQNLFKGVEGALIERDAALVESLEIDFNVTLPKAMKEGASVDDVRQIVEAMQTKLARARALLSAAEQRRKPAF